MALTYAANGGDLRITETANALLDLILVDLTDLFPLGVNLGDQAGRGSTSDQVSQIDLDDAMTAPGEGVAVGVTDPVTSSVSIAIARQALRRQETDLLRITGASSMFSLTPQMLAMDAAHSIVIRRTAQVAALFSAIGSSVGTTTVDLTVTNIYQAMFTLQSARTQPPFACVLFPEQFNNFQNSLRGEAGASAFQAVTAQMLAAKGPGYAGSWNNIEFWTSDQVPDANGGADSNGAMFARGWFGYKEASAASMLRASGSEIVPVPEFSPAFIELQRIPASGVTDAVYNYYDGVGALQDAKAVAIITDR